MKVPATVSGLLSLKSKAAPTGRQGLKPIDGYDSDENSQEYGGGSAARVKPLLQQCGYKLPRLSLKSSNHLVAFPSFPWPSGRHCVARHCLPVHKHRAGPSQLWVSGPLDASGQQSRKKPRTQAARRTARIAGSSHAPRKRNASDQRQTRTVSRTGFILERASPSS